MGHHILVVQRSPSGAFPGDGSAFEQLGKQARLLLEQPLVIIEVVAEQGERIDARTAAEDNLRPPTRDGVHPGRRGFADRAGRHALPERRDEDDKDSGSRSLAIATLRPARCAIRASASPRWPAQMIPIVLIRVAASMRAVWVALIAFASATGQSSPAGRPLSALTKACNRRLRLSHGATDGLTRDRGANLNAGGAVLDLLGVAQGVHRFVDGQ